MYSNLVHLEFLRLMKSRYFKAAVSLAAFFMLFFFMFFHYSLVDYLPELANVYIDRGITHQVAMGNVAVNVCWVIALIAVIFVTCDYYKYRLYVNFHSQLKNKIKHCSTEFAGYFLFSGVLAFFPVMVMFLVAFLDKRSLFTSIPRALIIYLAVVAVIFISGMPGFFFAKLTRRVWPTVICYILSIFGSIFFVGFLGGGLFAVGSDVEAINVDLIMGSTAYTYAISVITPENALLQWAMKSVPDTSFDMARVLFNYIALCLFWLCACSLVTKRRGDK